MTPENRARLHAVLRDSLSRAVLPAVAPEPHPGQKRGPLAGSITPPRPFPRTVAFDEPVAGTEEAARAEAEAAMAGDATAAAAALARDPLVQQFRREAEALTVHVYLAKDEDEATAGVLGVLKALEAKTVLAWTAAAIGLPGLPLALTKAGIETLPQEVPFEPKLRAARLAELADAAAGITGAAAGLADSGSLVLVHGPARGRLASLLPPVHIAVLRRGAIAPSLGELLARQPSLPEVSSNMAIITGPSRTADIEMTLSRGVHGPKEVHVILLP